MRPSAQSRPQSTLISAILFLMLIVFASPAYAQTETVIASPGITYAGLVFDTAGNLYGVTFTGGSSTNCSGGCGTVFELSPAGDGTWTQTTLYNFQNLSDGSGPYGGLVFDGAGNLYGANNGGGSAGNGVVYELSPSNGSWSLTTLYSFPVGLFPNSSLVFDKQGNLYGTSLAGGQYGGGTAYRVSLVSGSWKATTLHSFGAAGDGVRPNGPLVIDNQGNVFGTTQAGGAETWGIVFELSRQPDGSWGESTLYTFDSGGSPEAGLILDSAHNFYGATYTGGANGYGSVYRLTLINQNGQLVWKHILLYSFTGGADGANPASALTFDSAGHLYGTTDGGNPTGCNSFYGCGQVYKLAVGSEGLWSIAALYPIPSFLDPNGSLVLDSAGNIYGTAIDSHYFLYGDVYEVTQ